MHVTRIATTADLERLRPNWNCLTHGVPVRTWQWLFNWWKHYHENKSLYTLAVHDDAGVLVGVAPWFIERRGNDGRVIQFLGSGEACTDYLTLLATHEHASDVATAIAEWLVGATSGNGRSEDRWDLLDFAGILVGEPNMTALLAALRDRGCTANRRPAQNCWRLALPSSWDEFVSRLSRSYAKKLRKLSRRTFDSGCGVMRVAGEPRELELGMGILVDLHQRRWNSLGEPGCFASPQFSRFLHAAAADLLTADMLKLGWLEFDGEPVAAEFTLSTTDACFMYQGGLDPAKLKQSPGHASVSALIRDAIESGCQYFDFMRGDEPYKAVWGAQPLHTERIRVAPDRLGPQLRNHAWLAGQTMKCWIKQGLTLTGAH